MVKGFYAYFIADYNCYAKPAFSVGEYWDSSAKIREWVNNSRGYVSDTPTSAAFDFQFRYRVRDAINNADWRWLGYDEKPLSADNYYKQYAVTFVENHDTEHRINGAEQDPIRSDTLAANAYLLAMPGTPCVFYTHWRDCKYNLKQMILARRLAGICNTSSKEEKYSAKDYYAATVTGKNGTLLCVVGNKPQNYSVSRTQYTEILSGKGYRYLMSRNANTVWMDVPDGTYESPLKVTLSAISKLSGAKIVYTTDGSEPTAESAQIATGGVLSIESSCTLKAGLLLDGKVQNVQTRVYQIFEPHDITIHVSSDVAWSAMTFYIWDNNNNQLNGNWPGKRILTTKNIAGKRWYYQTIRLTSPEQYFNLVVSITSGSKQTVDVTGITSDCYLCIDGTKDGTKYIVKDMTADITTDLHLPADAAAGGVSKKAYNLQGLPVSRVNRKGVVIEGGRKTLYK